MAQAAVERPTALCPVVDQRPEMDGVLEEAVWGHVPVNAEFWDNNGDRPAEPPMQFRICTDGPRLYLAVELNDPAPSGYDLENRGRDQCDFSRETLELFVAPFADQPIYYHFALEPGGSDFDNVANGQPTDHNYSWQHAQQVHEKGWVAEIALPLAEMDRPAGVQAGDFLALNVCRETRGPMPLHCWAPTHGGFHHRSAFGEVVVGSFSDPALQQVETLEQQGDAARQRVPAEAQAELEAWAQELAALRETAGRLADVQGWQKFRVAAARARQELQRLALAGRGLVVWPLNPWSLPDSAYLPPADQEEVEEVFIEALQGEYLVRALGLANTGEAPLHVRCYTTDLLSPDWRRQAPAPEHLTLHEAVEVGLRGGGKQRDALPEIALEDRMVLPSGRNGVLWLTLNTHGLEPGLWTAGITLKPLLQPELTRLLRVVLKVLPVQLPPGPRPYSCPWTQLTDQPCVRYPEECVQDQLEHYTNVHIVPIGETGVQTIQYDEQGRATGEPDFSRLEPWLERYGTDGPIYVLVNWYRWLPQELGGQDGQWDEVEQSNFAWWVGKVREFFARHGLGPESFAYYALDEPCTEEDAQEVAHFGKLLQAADPEQQIFVTVYNAVTLEALRIMAPYVNLWVPSLGLNEEQREIVEKTHPEWRRLSYSVISRNGHPYWNYRLNGLTAFARGYEGIGFWSYNDCGGSPDSSVWDDNDGNYSDYAVIYEGRDGPVGSVRWEGWRQGVQDYRYCDWLLQLAGESPDGPWAAQARDLVGELLQQIHQTGQTTTADEYLARMRPLALRLLVAAGQVEEAILSQAQQELPFCLTNNGGEKTRNLNTHGCYFYNATPLPDHHGERSRVTEGPVYFDGDDAVAGPQADNKFDGDLTDGLLSYPQDFSIHWWPPAKLSLTFDFRKPYKLSHTLFYGDARPMVALVSETGEDGSWQQTAAVDAPRTEEQLSADGAAFFDLQGLTGRYVRLEIETGGEGVRMGEVKVWGWPLDPASAH